MSAADCRMEIISILVVSGHITSRELAQKFGVCVSTILLHHMGRRNSKKMYDVTEGENKKS